MTDNNVLTSILDSIKRNNVESFKMLLNSNLDCLNEITPFGTWLHVAASKGRLEILKTLIEKGIDINKCGGVFGGSAINEGASKGHYDIVNYLLLCGAEVDTSEPEKNPLFGAIMSGNKEIVQLLLDNGIDAAVKYTGDYMKNMDAYDFAIERGKKEIAEILKPFRK